MPSLNLNVQFNNDILKLSFFDSEFEFSNSHIAKSVLLALFRVYKEKLKALKNRPFLEPCLIRTKVILGRGEDSEVREGDQMRMEEMRKKGNAMVKPPNNDVSKLMRKVEQDKKLDNINNIIKMNVNAKVERSKEKLEVN